MGNGGALANVDPVLAVTKLVYTVLLPVVVGMGIRAIPAMAGGSTGLRPLCRKTSRSGRPVPSVETTFTRPNPVGDGTRTKCRCRYQISVLAPYKAGHLDCRMVCLLRHRGLSPVDVENKHSTVIRPLHPPPRVCTRLHPKITGLKRLITAPERWFTHGNAFSVADSALYIMILAGSALHVMI